MLRSRPGLFFGLSALAFVALGSERASAQGIYAPGIGPVNRSMGSAAVAAPLDGMGAINWNPATLSAFEQSELSCSVEFLIPNIDASSSVAGLGAGSTSSESGATLLPNMAWVHKTADPRLTIGFGVLSVAGFSTNYDADPTNPILAPQRTAGTFPLGGFGRVASEACFIDFSPTIAYAITDQFSVGVAPVFTMARLSVEPMVFAGLDDANGDTISTYPRGAGERYSWGGGANFGAYYIHDCNWRFGAGLKTPRWMESFRFNTEDEVGNPQVAKFNWELPMVVSLGTSYNGFESTVVALDVRYIDYDNANGFGDSGLNADGSLVGLGWRSVMAVAMGVQRQISDTTFLRAGYVYNQNPIPDSETQFNLAAPLHYQHTISGGLTYQPTRCIALHTSYSYTPLSEISSSIVLPPNAPTSTPPIAVPGSSVTSSLSAHALDFGVTVRY
ncbi:Outer membrane protein transport protein (OMPP1/FadL/TodX) [Botrimarina colliarenosi]|uniref:Outer membrane protein transport protein (OMPP1/FadL/TodX) n=1 Tax=Botrimarina colliarenosi TaxID=2528001 RepID=A0A5C5ZXU3_9BACT|nr:outer membrane protein transport protein [Botrimarina colliarenosi]TWT92472.1 Outer membrane protein transport protein (OMPP1/FadL/TodX) [Botrimarina colliarenosi]